MKKKFYICLIQRFCEYDFILKFISGDAPRHHIGFVAANSNRACQAGPRMNICSGLAIVHCTIQASSSAIQASVAPITKPQRQGRTSTAIHGGQLNPSCNRPSPPPAPLPCC